MATIQIRDIPDDVHASSSSSARPGQSLQAYMREQIVERRERRTRRTGADGDGEILRRRGPGMTLEEILEARDADRR